MTLWGECEESVRGEYGGRVRRENECLCRVPAYSGAAWWAAKVFGQFTATKQVAQQEHTRSNVRKSRGRSWGRSFKWNFRRNSERNSERNPESNSETRKQTGSWRKPVPKATKVLEVPVKVALCDREDVPMRRWAVFSGERVTKLCAHQLFRHVRHRVCHSGSSRQQSIWTRLVRQRAAVRKVVFTNKLCGRLVARSSSRLHVCSTWPDSKNESKWIKMNRNFDSKWAKKLCKCDDEFHLIASCELLC